MIAARSASPRFWLGLLLTAALHVAILWMFAQHAQLQDGTRREARTAIQWLLPMPKPALPPAGLVRPATRPPRAASPATSPTSPPAPSHAQAQQHGTAAGHANSEPAPATEPQTITWPAGPPDPFAASAARPPSAADIMAQARKDIGKIDQDLRKAYPERGTPPESRQARLERAFEAAHDAVAPKWYEPARTVEITPPNARTRMYRVTTALLTYCIAISEDGRKNYTNCPK